MCVGRRPNTKDLGLETCGIKVNERGQIPVDDNFMVRFFANVYQEKLSKKNKKKQVNKNLQTKKPGSGLCISGLTNRAGPVGPEFQLGLAVKAQNFYRAVFYQYSGKISTISAIFWKNNT